MRISIDVSNLKVNELIKVLDTMDCNTSFLIEDYGREFTFGELKKNEDKSVKE
jgi:hypothetical protein